jgi:hypothetical protein
MAALGPRQPNEKHAREPGKMEHCKQPKEQAWVGRWQRSHDKTPGFRSL